MAQYQITLDSSTLHQLFLGGSADPGMKPILELSAESMHG